MLRPPPSVAREGVLNSPGEPNFPPRLIFDVAGVLNAAFRFVELPAGPLMLRLGVFGVKSSSLCTVCEYMR